MISLFSLTSSPLPSPSAYKRASDLYTRLISARSQTTTSAPLPRRISGSSPRATPTTRPKPPARPALTPEMASSTTTARSGGTPSILAASSKVSGAGLPASFFSAATLPSTLASKRFSIPVAASTASPFLLEVTTATRAPGPEFPDQGNRRFEHLGTPGSQNLVVCRANAGRHQRPRSAACRPRTCSSPDLLQTARRDPLHAPRFL